MTATNPWPCISMGVTYSRSLARSAFVSLNEAKFPKQRQSISKKSAEISETGLEMDAWSSGEVSPVFIV